LGRHYRTCSRFADGAYGPSAEAIIGSVICLCFFLYSVHFVGDHQNLPTKIFILGITKIYIRGSDRVWPIILGKIFNFSEAKPVENYHIYMCVYWLRQYFIIPRPRLRLEEGLAFGSRRTRFAEGGRTPAQAEVGRLEDRCGLRPPEGWLSRLWAGRRRPTRLRSVL